MNRQYLPLSSLLDFSSQRMRRKASKSQSQNSDEFRYEAEADSQSNGPGGGIEAFRRRDNRDDAVDHPDTREGEGEENGVEQLHL